MGIKNPSNFEEAKILNYIFEEKRSITLIYFIDAWKETCYFVGA